MKVRFDVDPPAVSSTHPVSLGWVSYAIVLLGIALLTFVWGMYQYHHNQLHEERLQAKGNEHLNLAVIIAENTRQIAERGRALGSIYRATARQQNDAGVDVARLLANDPIFSRMSIYNGAGELMFASVSPSLEQLPAQWLSQLRDKSGSMVTETIMPSVWSKSDKAEPAHGWRLPFLVPLSRDYGESAQVMLIEMDMGYLLSLYQYVDLGESGFFQLLDANGHERVRVDATGVISDGQPLLPLPPHQPEGLYTSMSGGRNYQSAFYSLPQHGFTVVINKEYAEILAPYLAGKSRQFLINILVSLITICCLFWMLRLLHRQQLVVEAVQDSQQENKQLIIQLEAEHERSSRAASTDHLSGLHNRRQFIEEANLALLKQRNKRRLLSLLFIDLDRFKSINDTLGHRIGDLLLQAVAGRIQRLLGPDDQAARFGGDEFVVLLAGDRTEQEIVDWVDTLTQRLSAVYQLEGNEVNTSPSIGVAICPRDAQDVDALIRNADAAMYSAKRAGRGQYRFFDQSLNVVDVEEFRLEQAFAEALKQHQFVLHYQPQIALDTLSIIGYEALIRWQHPEYGLIYPDRFIHIAERSGFIIALGNEVVSLACQQLAEWAAEGALECVTVNVSALQLSQPEFSDMVLNTIHQHGLEPWQLELEITETAIFEKQEVAIAGLERLRTAGLTISLDDFGKGYAGFAHLNALPINKLKIDRSLIAELSNSHDDSFIVSSTITLAKRLSLQVVGEGVETPEQVVYLRLAGCDVAQGYHFSRPLKVDQVNDFRQTFRIKNRATA